MKPTVRGELGMVGKGTIIQLSCSCLHSNPPETKKIIKGRIYTSQQRIMAPRSVFGESIHVCW